MKELKEMLGFFFKYQNLKYARTLHTTVSTIHSVHSVVIWTICFVTASGM